MGILDLFRSDPKKSELLGLQKVLVENSPDKLVYDENTLRNLANMKAKSDLQKIDDCLSIIRTTNNSDTFYSRIDFLESVLNRLVQLEPFVKFSGTTPSAIREAWYRDKQQIIRDFESKPGALYYANMEKIETQWSVLTNLKIFTGAQADAFEALCKQNIREFYEMVGYNKGQSQGYVVPSRVPAYTRIAMLYERQEEYQKAIDICADAIRNGVVDDDSKGKMYGRLARMIRKSGVEVGEDIKRLAAIY